MPRTPVPKNPQIAHIVHVDRLSSIIKNGFLWCDAEVAGRSLSGTTIGIDEIKRRRMSHPLASHPTLTVGACVPFYFSPRSVMLYMIDRANHPALTFRGGQAPIVHLVADLRKTVRWAKRKDLRWAFTLTNAGASYFEDRCSLDDLCDIDWDAVKERYWRDPQSRITSRRSSSLRSAFLGSWSLASA